MQKSIVVSGADGALGGAIVSKFIEKDYLVAQIHLHPKSEPGSKNIKHYTANLADERASESAINQICNDLGKIDVLACIAGGFAMGNLENTPAALIQRQLDLNFFTTYNLVRPIYREMKKQGYGRIFLTGSRQGLSPRLGLQSIAYTLSKSLLFSLADVLNADKDCNVVTSVIVPSIIDTPANRASMPDSDFSKWVSAESISEIMSFYASEAADAIRQPIVKVFNHS